jgi:hypothetical protein
VKFDGADVNEARHSSRGSRGVLHAGGRRIPAIIPA